MRRLARTTLTALALTATALSAPSCVPASAAAPPAGALGWTLEPSAATRGEPFATVDGWTVRIEKAVFQVAVSVGPPPGSNQDFSYQSDSYRFDAAQPATIFARAISAGPATSSGLDFTPNYFERRSGAATDDPSLEILGVSPASNARFRAPPDVTQSADFSSYGGPSVLLAVRAQQGERVVAFDLTFEVYGSSGPHGSSTLVVLANALVTLPATVVAEAAFGNTVDQLRFDPFAAADTNGDGIVSAAELAVASDCTSDCGNSSGSSSLVQTLQDRIERVFVPK